MSDSNDVSSEEKEQREGEIVRARLIELYANPIQGNFDTEHLKAIHAYLFQDLPEYSPGITRDNERSWVKHRTLEGERVAYDVPYKPENTERHIEAALQNFGGVGSLKGLTPDEAAERIAELYSDLDHAHGFYEGNSRTLREFTRLLALAAGFVLDWVRTGVGAKERNTLYMARDVAILERHYPDLTPERAMTTNNRNEYEASFVLAGLRRSLDGQSLSSNIRSGLTGAPKP